LFVTETIALAHFNSQIGTIGGAGQRGLNLAQIRVLHMTYNTNFEVFALLTTSEYYYNSIMLSQKVGDNFAAV
jgi:hypothetical protein